MLLENYLNKNLINKKKKLNQMNQEAKTYEVNLVKRNQLLISGKGDDQLWNTAMVLKDFCSPWNNEKQAEITFKALWDLENFFLTLLSSILKFILKNRMIVLTV